MLSDFHNRPAFEAILPKRAIAPLLFNSAHSGADYPKRFIQMSKLDRLSIRQSEDAYINELFAQAPHLGAPMLHAHFPRAYLDVNREPYELDPKMFSEKLPKNYNINSPRVAAGIGTLARVVCENKPIYKKKLTIEDAKMRIEGIYRPYHQTLQKLLTKALRQFGVAVLIDCHSMPTISSLKDRANPDIVLGDRHGTSCSRIIIDLIENIFTSAGLRVSRNRPYAGGFITKSYGQPKNNIHAIQIEISRHLYMNEATLTKNENFSAIKQIINKLIVALIELDIRALTQIPYAAE